MNRLHTWLWMCAAACVLLPAQLEAKPPVVLELFTSQGCPSCPPADEVFGKLIDDNRDIIALSFHVDYWDRQGWKDPYSLAESTARQNDYADAMHSTKLFTPQVIVNGSASFIGTKQHDIRQAMNEARRSEAPYLPVALDPTAEGMRVTITPQAEGNIRGEADIWLVAYEKEGSTRVRRGANWGKTLNHYHSVRQILYLGKWHENAVAIDLDFKPDTEFAAILLQRPDGGRIIGASQLRLKN